MKRHFRELFIAYILLCGINYFFFRDNPGFVDTQLHPYLFLTVLFAVRYGVWEGSLAGFIGAGLILAAYHFRGDDLLLDYLFDFSLLSLPAALVILGLLIGEAVESRLKRANHFRSSLSLEVQEHEKIKKAHLALQGSMLLLEKKLANQSLGVQDFSEAMLELFAGSRREIYEKLEKLLTTYLHVEESFALLSIGDVYHQEPVVFEHPMPPDNAILAAQQSPCYTEALYQRKTISLTDFMTYDGAKPVTSANVFFCGPVIGLNGHIDAMILITKIPFIHFNITNFRLFEVVLSAASVGLVKLEQQEKLRKATPYHEHFLVERSNYFLKNLLMEFAEQKKIEVICCGFAFSRFVKEPQKIGFLTLLSQLCLKPYLRVGYFEGAAFFACHATRSGDLADLNLEVRFASYGFTAATARLVVCRVPIDEEQAQREQNYLGQFLEQQFRTARGDTSSAKSA